MDLKEWFASAQHCGVVYFVNSPSKTGASAKLMFYTITNESIGPRLVRAWPNENGHYSESLAKKIGFRLGINVSEPHFYVKGSGFSRSEHVLDNIWHALYSKEPRPHIYCESLTIY